MIDCLQTLFSIIGDVVFADRVEQYDTSSIVNINDDDIISDNLNDSLKEWKWVNRLAFNALPATFTADMWEHQYLQQANEMNSAHLGNYLLTFIHHAITVLL
jgi:hypothetical protein